ncbi:hypothetical protein PMAYCL1PPCAC_19871, partial [Pristionchus mayeri]
IVLSLLSIASPQGISYDSFFCAFIGIQDSSEAMIGKYQKMIANTNNDTTLAAQQNRVRKFIIRNWRKLEQINVKSVIPVYVRGATNRLETRWRIVEFLENLLSKMKPIVDYVEYQEISASLWSMDQANKQNVLAYYDDWKKEAIDKISSANKRQEITELFEKEEKSEDFVAFGNNLLCWIPVRGFTGCF